MLGIIRGKNHAKNINNLVFNGCQLQGCQVCHPPQTFVWLLPRFSTWKRSLNPFYRHFLDTHYVSSAQSRPHCMKTQCKNKILFPCLPLVPWDLWIASLPFDGILASILRTVHIRAIHRFQVLPLSLCSAWKWTILPSFHKCQVVLRWHHSLVQENLNMLHLILTTAWSTYRIFSTFPIVF